MDMMSIINFSASLCSLFITIMLLAAAALGGNLHQRVYRWFFITLLVNLLILLFEFTIGLLEGHVGPVIRAVLHIADFLTYVAAGLQYIAFSFYLYEYISTKKKTAKTLVYIITCISIVIVIMAAIAGWTDMYAKFDDLNYYHQQDSYWIAQILPMLTLFFYTVFIVRNAKGLTFREWGSLLLYIVIQLTCYVVETLSPELWLAHVGATLCMFIIYVNIQVELRQQAKVREAELAESRIAVMISQIQPHFLYNSLTAISNLCNDQPDAQKALITFSEYLRVNMDSLSQKMPIPFAKELEHVRQYLWLEQLRFGQRLQVVYDIQTELFMLPVLTLQPIVENAVRYGITKKRAGGTVTIRTEEDETAVRIVVEDDGTGFDPGAITHDGRSHMGLSNVRSRLAAICGGQLIIQSEAGQGTVATIEIPKKGDASNAHHRGGR